MDAAAVAAAWYAAALSTVVAIFAGVNRLRSRRPRVSLRPSIVWPADGSGPLIHMEAVNIGERKISLSRWVVRQTGNDLEMAGSPYEGEAQHGPGMLEPDQMRGWNIRLAQASLDLERPILVDVTLTTGQTFSSQPITVGPDLMAATGRFRR